MDEVKQIAHGHDATVNDMLLAVTAAGLRGLLRSRGEPGQMVVSLPVGVPDSGPRLKQIAAETAIQKAQSHPNLGTMFRSRIARRALLAFLDQHPVSVTTAGVPGPPMPVYLAGARLLEVFPVLPLIAKVTLGVGALSYAGQFNITVVADSDAVPDLEVFAEAARSELRALRNG